MQNLAHEVLLLMANLSGVKSDETVIRLFVEAMNQLIGPLSLRFVESRRQGTHEFDVIVAGQRIGEFVLEGDRSTLDPEAFATLRSAFGIVRLTLENNHRSRLLADQNLHLDEMVRQQTKELHDALELFKLVEEATEDGIWDINLRTKRMYLSPRIATMIGRDPAELPPVTEGFPNSLWNESMHPEDRERVLMAVNRMISGIADSMFEEFRVVLPSGEARWVQSRGRVVAKSPDGRPVRLCGVRTDITEHKRLREAYQNVLRTTRDGFVMYGQDGRIVEVNDALCAMLGYSREELCRMGVRDLEAVEAANESEHNTSRMLGYSSDRFETKFLRKDGSPIELDVSTTALDSNRKICALARDVTERNAALRALRESEERQRELFEQARDMIFAHDLEGRFTSVNQYTALTLGYSKEELLGKHVSTLVAPESTDEASRMMLRRIAGEETPPYEITLLAKDGHRVRVEANARLVVRDGRPFAIEGIARDLTRRKQLEEQLLQARKMESVGRLAGGIAHDFNNLLTVISGYAELALKKAQTGGPIASDISGVVEAARKATTLTRQLTAFSRKQPLQPRELDLNQIIGDLERLLRRLIGEDILLEVSLDPAIGPVHADAGQLEQVLMNLAANARDAMSGGGRLRIETHEVTHDPAAGSRFPDLPAGRFISMRVSDTGHGMDAETASHAFEPFYTTKDLGKGSGLGLATVYGIVRQCGGGIRVESAPEQGATFEVLLPCSKGLVRRAHSPHVDPSAHGTETILLVEDQSEVRALSAEALRECGYHIFEASNGEEALRVFATIPDRVDLLLTDIVMPGMDGRELASRLHVDHQTLKVLCISGYADLNKKHAVQRFPMLWKPFTPVALARKVREVLDASREPKPRRS